MPQTARQQTERELAVLRLLHESETVPQRDIARRTGMSLGLTNAVLKRLAHKGYVTMRKATGRQMAYAVTPDGVNEIAKRTYRYFRRTMQHVVRYKEAIDAFVERAAQDGYRTVNLEGKSDVDFLVEHACSAAGLEYRRRGDAAADGATLRLLGERESQIDSGRDVGPDTCETVHLWNVLLAADEGKGFGG